MNRAYIFTSVFISLWFWLMGSALAETAYVTDELQLDMYASADMTGSAIKKLRSGDKVEVLERNGRYAQIRSASGQSGWVKGLYLVKTEPARTRVNQLERSNKGMDTTIKKLRSQLVAEQARAEKLEAVQTGAAEQTSSVEVRLAELAELNGKLEKKLSSYGPSIPLKWAFLVMGLSLVGGLLGGWYFIDKRSRQRHGGYRIY
jgi:SH3 domain protein